MLLFPCVDPRLFSTRRGGEGGGGGGGVSGGGHLESWQPAEHPFGTAAHVAGSPNGSEFSALHILRSAACNDNEDWE